MLPELREIRGNMKVYQKVHTALQEKEDFWSCWQDCMFCWYVAYSNFARSGTVWESMWGVAARCINAGKWCFKAVVGDWSEAWKLQPSRNFDLLSSHKSWIVSTAYVKLYEPKLWGCHGNTQQIGLIHGNTQQIGLILGRALLFTINSFHKYLFPVSMNSVQHAKGLEQQSFQTFTGKAGSSALQCIEVECLITAHY